MNKILICCIGCLILVFVFSCDTSLSDGTDILSFTITGIVGKAEIDPINKTIDFRIRPINLVGLNPVITVTEGAIFTLEGDLVDGKAVDLIVTAENGKEAKWSITANMNRGIYYEIDGIPHSFSYGFTDNTNIITAEEWGNGEPCITSDLRIFAATHIFHKNLVSYNPDEFVIITLSSFSAGNYDESDVGFLYSFDEDQNNSADSGIITVSMSLVLENESTLGDDLYGSFNLIGEDPFLTVPIPINVTNGYFKVLSIVHAF
ncbi:MAG: hypothetical protein JEY91_00235 [Spirochaetaceae bacterium]|nr:hypothetical protein [Spirochaetaceae bacterium]